MFEKTQSVPVVRPPTKEAILKQVDEIRDLARRARRLAGIVTDEGDRRRLNRYVDELGESASRLEKSAIEAKTS
jgi:hypothetical protein